MQRELDCISEVLDIEVTKSDLNKSLDEFEEWDSISFLGMMVKADEDFDISLKPDELEAAENIQDLVNLLRKLND